MIHEDTIHYDCQDAGCRAANGRSGSELDVERLARALAATPQQPFRGGFVFRFWKYEALAAAIVAEYAAAPPSEKVTP